MKIKELLGRHESAVALQEARGTAYQGIELEQRTPIWQKLDSMIEYLKVYRTDFKGTRAPVWERQLIESRRAKKLKLQEELLSPAVKKQSSFLTAKHNHVVTEVDDAMPPI